MIAFVGSVFSPYYAAARRRDAPTAEPSRHNAFNVALYGPGRHRWAMTERGAGALRRDATRLQIGPSALAWRGERLEIDVDEWTAPWPSRLRGRIVVEPLVLPGVQFGLDAATRHLWTPIAPCARVEVRLDQPAWRWQGTAYLDSNRGERPLETDFVHWEWSRAALAGGRSAVHYDILRRDGSTLSLPLHFDADGGHRMVDAPPAQALPDSAWRLGRAARSDAGTPPELLRRFEDGPFYARALVGARWRGEPVHAVHESLSLDRFASRWVQCLLPFRMPRHGG